MGESCNADVELAAVQDVQSSVSSNKDAELRSGWWEVASNHNGQTPTACTKGDAETGCWSSSTLEQLPR